MITRVIELGGHLFHWPVGSHKPTTFAFQKSHLERFEQTQGAYRIANNAERDAALAANTAGPQGRRLSSEELVRCYMDEIGFEQFHRIEGVEARGYERS